MSGNFQARQKSMNLEKSFDNIHGAAIGNRWLQLFTAFTRVILAVGFIPPSIPKIMNIPFTVLPDTNPVGHYFNALYHTGHYYQFIGWGQILAALLLLFPRTAHLGALMFFPIIVNITVLTNSVGFVGTKYITVLMLLACTYLLTWEYDRLKSLFFSKRQTKTMLPRLEFFWLPVSFAFGGAAMAAFFATFGVANIHRAFLPVLLVMTAGGFIFGLICTAHHRFMKTGQLEKSVNSV
jgi:hypothetical protein